MSDGWIHDALEMLRELGLIAHAKVTQSDKTEKPQILPTHPPDKISLAQVTKMTETPISDWMDSWEPAGSKSLKTFAKNVKANPPSALMAATFDTFMG